MVLSPSLVPWVSFGTRSFSRPTSSITCRRRISRMGSAEKTESVEDETLQPPASLAHVGFADLFAFAKKPCSPRAGWPDEIRLSVDAKGKACAAGIHRHVLGDEVLGIFFLFLLGGDVPAPAVHPGGKIVAVTSFKWLGIFGSAHFSLPAAYKMLTARGGYLSRA